jgi:hypothetical protein
MGQREAFHTTLSRVLDAPLSPDPELHLANALAKKEAAGLLAQEGDLF